MDIILTAVDFSDVTDEVIAQTAKLAVAFGSVVHLLHIEAPEPDFIGYEPGPQHERDHVAHAVVADHRAIQGLRDRLKDEGIDAHSLVAQGPTVEKICEKAEQLDADLIIVGSHGHGALYNLVLGSVSEGVMRRAQCPVLVVPSEQTPQ